MRERASGEKKGKEKRKKKSVDESRQTGARGQDKKSRGNEERGDEGRKACKEKKKKDRAFARKGLPSARRYSLLPRPFSPLRTPFHFKMIRVWHRFPVLRRRPRRRRHRRFAPCM